MSKVRRMRNVQWDIGAPNSAGAFEVQQAMLAVLLDIRESLHSVQVHSSAIVGAGYDSLRELERIDKRLAKRINLKGNK